MKGLYIHIPFCLSKCPYCSFSSQTDLSLIPAFLAGLRREMALYTTDGEAYDTVYLGGGTPSVLDASAMARLLADLRAAFSITPDAEITCEANPGDITRELLECFRKAGVNRLTIGCQSFDDQTLAFLGRRHRAAEAIGAIEAARQAGLTNLCLDLICGLPDFSGDPFPVWLSTLQTALALSPPHLSCYQLTLEPGAPLGERLRNEGLAMPDEEIQAGYFHRTAEVLEAAGYVHYEVSNFARGDAYYSRHNSKYWDHTPYLGLGPAAHSFTGRVRRWNRPDVHGYLQNLAAGQTPVAGSETLTDEQLALEALFLGLRTRRGVALAAYRRQYGKDLEAEKGAIIAKLVQEGLVERQGDWLRPTRAGMAVADSLALI